MNRRRFLASLVTGGFAASALPASAQIMPEQGIPLPFFRSRSEEIARRACMEGLPECRASVRAQMEFERSITVAFPWALVGVVLLGILFWMRAQDKKKAQHRAQARRRHDPAKYKNLDKTKAELERARRARDPYGDDDDGL